MLQEVLWLGCERAQELDSLFLLDRMIVMNDVLVQVLVECATMVSPVCSILHERKDPAQSHPVGDVKVNTTQRR